MHVDRVERLTRPREELGELLDVLGRFRWRLAGEQLLLFVLRAAIVSCAAITVLSVTAWLTDLPLLTPPVLLAISFVPIGVASVVALLRWPSAMRAARAADQHLDLAERLATALEIVRRPKQGLFDRMQVHDAITTARAATGGWPSTLRGARTETRLGSVALVLAAASLLLPLVQRPTLPTPVAESGLAEIVAEAERIVTADLPDAAMAELEALESLPIEPNLAPRVQQALVEREALDRLADALNQISAGQGAADAIERGDFGAARDQLAALGEEADQLSDAAKRRLSQALQASAAATTGDRQLAERERQAAQALTRSNYGEQRQALRQLGDQVERSGARSLSPSQLARDNGRLQQQQQQQQQPQATNNGQPSSSRGQSQSASAQAGAGQAQQSSDQGSGGASAEGDQSGSGAGSGATDPMGGANDLLGTVGERVEVPTKLGAGPGQRPITGNEEEAGSNPGMGARSVAEAAHAQQTGQVAPEQNLVPGEQRPVVRGYFR